MEKPLADSIEDAEAMIATAERHDRVLMCDHTYCYTPAVQYLRSIVRAGDLGDLQFIDSVRINLGLVQRDVDVVWDLAPHDLSILDAVLPPGTGIRSLSATGADPVGAGQACVGLPVDGARRGSDRPRARQLAEPDQGAPDDDRRVARARSCGTTSIPCNASACSTAVSTSPCDDGPDAVTQPQDRLPRRRHGGAGAPRA